MCRPATRRPSRTQSRLFKSAETKLHKTWRSDLIKSPKFTSVFKYQSAPPTCKNKEQPHAETHWHLLIFGADVSPRTVRRSGVANITHAACSDLAAHGVLGWSICSRHPSQTVFMFAGIQEVAPTPVFQPQYSLGEQIYGLIGPIASGENFYVRLSIYLWLFFVIIS